VQATAACATGATIGITPAATKVSGLVRNRPALDRYLIHPPPVTGQPLTCGLGVAVPVPRRRPGFHSGGCHRWTCGIAREPSKAGVRTRGGFGTCGVRVRGMTANPNFWERSHFASVVASGWREKRVCAENVFTLSNASTCGVTFRHADESFGRPSFWRLLSGCSRMQRGALPGIPPAMTLRGTLHEIKKLAYGGLTAAALTICSSLLVLTGNRASTSAPETRSGRVRWPLARQPRWVSRRPTRAPTARPPASSPCVRWRGTPRPCG
jgi:hypothetical protein